MPLPLREKQIGQLAHYIANPKTLDLSDPSTGKTPPICVYAYWHWTKNAKKTLWTMPKSLLKKNKLELHRFTDFVDDDVVILRTDRANLTQNYGGPTIDSTRRRQGYEVIYQGQRTNTINIRQRMDEPVNFSYLKEGNVIPLNKHSKNGIPLLVQPVLGPDGEPTVAKYDEPEVFKDLIKIAAQTAKVVITTFKFAQTHWKRLLEDMPDIDLFLVDEIHMPGGYSTPSSKATESFYHINRHTNRFVAMTGTLINGRLDSAYPAISVIEPRYYGSLHGFMYEHAAVVDDYGRVVVWKNEPKLKKIIDRHSIKLSFEEVYGDEPVVFFTEYVDIDEKVKPYYDEFQEQALLELEDGRILDGSMAGVAIMRVRQILSHPETMFKDIPVWTPKDERVQIHLSEGKKTLIYASLIPEQERLLRLAESLGLRAALINSTVTGSQREKIDAMAQAGELDVIVASGPTAAVGFNWEMFDVVIFASVDFMDTNVLQAYRRASRGTRTSTLRVIFLRYRSPVETRMYGILTDKNKLARTIDPTRPLLSFTEE